MVICRGYPLHAARVELLDSACKGPVRWEFLIPSETELCHVIAFWKLSYERMFC